MTEAEWLASTDPASMLEFLQCRKLRLFAVACARRIWHLLPDDACRQAVEVADRYADGLASEIERATAERDAFWFDDYGLSMVSDLSIDEWCQPIYFPDPSPELVIAEAAVNTLAIRAGDAATYTARCAQESVPAEERANERIQQAHLLRDLFGSPFRLRTIDPSWLTPNVVHLAQTVYQDRAFNLLPILADALEGSGCSDPAILGHLRSPGPHVRGCWVIDLLLAKQ